MPGMECLPGDDTETCCLKEHPGEWERCTGTAGPRNQPRTGNQPKPKGEPAPKGEPEPQGSPEPDLPPIPTPEQKQDWNERCRDHYVRCKHSPEGERWGRKFSESQCQACWDLCRRTGEWPDEANGKPCPGG